MIIIKALGVNGKLVGLLGLSNVLHILNLNNAVKYKHKQYCVILVRFEL